MLGKAFDCRLGCACVIETLKELKGQSLDVDVVGVFSTQEEVGTRGAQVAAQTVKPDIAIVFEGSPADDTFTPDYLIQTALGRGPMLRHIDAKMITNPRFIRYAIDLGEKLGIPVQQAVRTGRLHQWRADPSVRAGGAGYCHRSAGSVYPYPSLLCIPVRF